MLLIKKIYLLLDSPGFYPPFQLARVVDSVKAMNNKHHNKDDPFDNPTGAMVTVFKRLMKAFLEAVDTASK